MTMAPDNGSPDGFLHRAEFEAASALAGRIARRHRVAKAKGRRPGQCNSSSIFPIQTDEESSRAVGLARQAPSFTMEWTGSGRMSFKVSPSLQTDIDLAVQLVGEAIEIPGAWAIISARPLATLAKHWQRLNCFVIV